MHVCFVLSLSEMITYMNMLKCVYLQGSVADTAYRQERHREKENMTDFIEKKRQMFLVQMSLDTKRAEIRKLEEQAQQREEALRKSEQMLEEDASRFELFLKMNDQKAVDAIRKAEAETKSKQDKVQEIKKLNAQIAAVKSEMAKYDESLEECQAYKKFLDELTPQDYIQEQIEAHAREIEEKRRARRAEREAEREAEDRQLEKEFQAEMEALKNVKGKRPDVKLMQQKETDHQARMAQLARDREKEDQADAKWDPDEGRRWEVPMYFKRPQQLLDIFAALEERNLFLIQNSQETEEQLEELKQKLEITKAKMDEETEQLQSQINSLKNAISLEESKATALRERANPLKGQDDMDTMVAQLQKRVAEVYERCAFEAGSNTHTLLMLANIEAKLEEYLAAIDMMPQEEVRVSTYFTFGHAAPCAPKQKRHVHSCVYWNS
jgi:DNA repair exonuclease SbcCD ATPase subunit